MHELERATSLLPTLPDAEVRLWGGLPLQKIGATGLKDHVDAMGEQAARLGIAVTPSDKLLWDRAYMGPDVIDVREVAQPALLPAPLALPAPELPFLF